MEKKQYTGLILVSGVDTPGITQRLFEALSPFSISIIDIEQVVIRDRLILLDGWSKTYAMTGWRLGYAVWPKSLVADVTRLCINDHSCVNASAQYAGLAALTGPQDAVAEMMVAFDQRRQLIVQALNRKPSVSSGCRRQSSGWPGRGY